MANKYRQGADFERKVRSHLESMGFFVIRSAGSKTKVDLVALRADNSRPYDQRAVWFVQCKRSKLPGPAERVALVECAGRVKATPIVARSLGRGKGIEYLRGTWDGARVADWVAATLAEKVEAAERRQNG